jgi:hypothetical protein
MRIPTEWSYKQFCIANQKEEVMQESQEEDGLLFKGRTGWQAQHLQIGDDDDDQKSR